MLKLIIKNESLCESVTALLTYKFPTVNDVISKSCDFLHTPLFFLLLPSPVFQGNIFLLTDQHFPTRKYFSGIF